MSYEKQRTGTDMGWDVGGKLLKINRWEAKNCLGGVTKCYMENAKTIKVTEVTVVMKTAKKINPTELTYFFKTS